jgi:capsular polysaccharide biosynthesis protein
MELRRYWQIFLRRWLFVVIPTAIVLIIGLATYQAPPPAYNVGVTFIVSQQPSEAATGEDQERYYSWLTSEYIVNGLADWVIGNAFKTAVSAELAAQGYDIPAGAIGIVADNVRSKLQISMSHNDPEALAAMMDAVITVVTEQNAVALPQLGGETAVLYLNDEPIVNQVPTGIRSQLDLPLRVGLAIVAGLGLALLAEYLDPTVRERREVEEIGLSILGEIPKK